MWLLVVEDERRLAESLRKGLHEEGHVVELALDGDEGERLAVANDYDALIVDWRLPKQDGKTLVENLRKAGVKCPILMLTALGDIEHRVQGLDAGADDYLPKPFAFQELLARIRALGRRGVELAAGSAIQLGNLSVDTRDRRVTCRDTELVLRPKEYALLELLARNEGSALSRTVIAERVWGNAFYVSDNVIDVTVSNLRNHLRDCEAGSGIEIETVRGVGYRLVASRGSE